MEIDFNNKKLADLCTSSRVADKSLGRHCAKKLRTRLADIDAAKNVAELIAGRPHPLKGEREGEFSLDLAGGVRLVFTPIENPPPSKPDGGIDWAMVESVKIVYIGDYHD